MAKAKKSEPSKTEKKSAATPAKATTKSKAAPKAAEKSPAKHAAKQSVAAKGGSKSAAAPAKKPVAKRSLLSPGMPMIDTNLVAQNAAAMLANRDVVQNPAGTPAPKQESSAFKNLKDQIA